MARTKSVTDLPPVAEATDAATLRPGTRLGCGWATPLYQLGPLRVSVVLLKLARSQRYPLVAMEPDPHEE
jgi:hypothetical protein